MNSHMYAVMNNDEHTNITLALLYQVLGNLFVSILTGKTKGSVIVHIPCLCVY